MHRHRDNLNQTYKCLSLSRIHGLSQKIVSRSIQVCFTNDPALLSLGQKTTILVLCDVVNQLLDVLPDIDEKLWSTRDHLLQDVLEDLHSVLSIVNKDLARDDLVPDTILLDQTQKIQEMVCRLPEIESKNDTDQCRDGTLLYSGTTIWGLSSMVFCSWFGILGILGGLLGSLACICLFCCRRSTSDRKKLKSNFVGPDTENHNVKA